MDLPKQEFTAAEALDEEAAFEAGFNGADAQDYPESVAQLETTEDPAPSTEEPAAAEPEIEEPARYTLAEVEALLEAKLSAYASKTELEKAHDRLSGKLGEYNQKLHSMATNRFNPDRQRLEAEFPELAEMLFGQGAPEPSQEPAPQPAAAAPSVDVAQLQTSFDQKLAKEVLTLKHEDWTDVVQSPSFTEWTATLEPELANEIATSWDGHFLAKQITAFKKVQAAQAEAAEKARAKVTKLDAAVIPKGVPKGNSNYEDDDEESAMLKAFGNRR